MKTGDATRLEMIDEVLAAHAGNSATGPGAGGTDPWERLVAQLSPLIGEVGLCALFARARHLSSPERHPYAANAELRSSKILLETLAAQLQTMEPAQARAYNAALLATFTRLLAGLIGEALTARLLNTAWAERPDRKTT